MEGGACKGAGAAPGEAHAEAEVPDPVAGGDGGEVHSGPKPGDIRFQVQTAEAEDNKRGAGRDALLQRGPDPAAE